MIIDWGKRLSIGEIIVHILLAKISILSISFNYTIANVNIKTLLSVSIIILQLQRVVVKEGCKMTVNSKRSIRDKRANNPLTPELGYGEHPVGSRVMRNRLFIPCALSSLLESTRNTEMIIFTFSSGNISWLVFG